MTDERDHRIAELESQLDYLASRHAALEWIVEQHFAHYLLDVPSREGFLAGIANPPPAFQVQPEGFETRPPPHHAEQLQRDIEHIVGKIATRTRQGIRHR